MACLTYRGFSRRLVVPSFLVWVFYVNWFKHRPLMDNVRYFSFFKPSAIQTISIHLRSIMADVMSFVLTAAWTILSTVSPTMKNNVFDVVFPDQAALEQMAASLNLIFASNLLKILQSTSPPTIQFFKTLPPCVKHSRVWAVYLLTLERPGYKSKIYIGSGTQSVQGVWARKKQHDIGDTCPLHVQNALRNEYKITHMGLLCHCSVPAIHLRPTVRTFFVVLECYFSFALWAMIATKGDYGMGSICIWGRNNLEYSGLCSHCCLHESIPGDWDLSKDDMERLEELRKAKGIARNQKSVDKRRAEKKYWCGLCKFAASGPSILRKHNLSQGHNRRAENLANPKKPFKCLSCSINFPSNAHLKRHNSTTKHKAAASNSVWKL